MQPLPPVIAVPWPKLIAAFLFSLESTLAAGNLSDRIGTSSLFVKLDIYSKK